VIVVAFMLVRTFLYGPPDLPEPRAATEIDVDLDGAAKRLSAGIRIRTISVDGQPADAQAFRDMAELLESAFPRVHADLTRETIADHSLLYRWEGQDPKLPPVLFSAHMDVVPADPETLDAWTYPPFSGQIADGMIWGRGALDMKQSLFSMMEAAETLLARGHRPKRTVLFAFTHDEEIGATGAAAIAKTLTERGVRLHMTLDEGLMVTNGVVPNVEPPVVLVGVAQKGYLTIELIARSTGGHSSMPPKETAVSHLVAAVATLMADPPAARLQSPTSDMLASLAPEMPFSQRFALANAWLLEPIILSMLENVVATDAVVRTTMAPTMLSGGVAENVLPQSARATINFRILPGDTIEQIIAEVRRKIDDPEIEIRVVGEPSPPSKVSDLWSRAARPLVDAVRTVFPNAVLAPGLAVSISDTRRYGGTTEQSFFFLPTRIDGSDLDRIHGVNERLAVESYGGMVQFYAQFIVNLSAAVETE
jgi:carboxypeptidase PM20D1